MDKIRMIILMFVRRIYFKFRGYRDEMLSKTTEFGLEGHRCIVAQPFLIVHPENVYMHEYARINPNSVILSNKGKFVMGKYSVASIGLSVVPDMHTSTVGIPQCCLGASHIHDKIEDVIVDEDVWIGMNVTLLGGAHLHRGCIVGANTLLSKHFSPPPYSVVAGNPARIIAVKFNIEQILQHEAKLYSSEERFTRDQLEELFTKYYEGKRVFGVDANFSEDDETKLKNTMQFIGFKYPEFD